MDSRIKILGHPVHQMLVMFPLGLLAAATVFDQMPMFTDKGQWHTHAFMMMGAGITAAMLAAPFGAMDFLAIPQGTRAKNVAMVHGGGNLLVTLLFGASWFLRYNNPAAPSALALGLSFAGASISLATAWLGNELVDRLGVGVSSINLNAPSSLLGTATDKGDRPFMTTLGGANRATTSVGSRSLVE